MAAQIGPLRAEGGDVRVSFGGASGSEPATTRSSADAPAAAYGKAVDAFKPTKVDYDVEGGALADTAANRTWCSPGGRVLALCMGALP
ncbi:hypothetical protein ACE1SV_23790 [Streptomyces sp. E-15]